MSFLLGAFGLNCNSFLIKKLSCVAKQSSSEGTLQMLSLDNGILFAGQKRDESYCYNDIIKLGDFGFTVGKIFKWDNCTKIDTFSNDEVLEFVSDSKKISKKIWGRYVSVFFNQQNKTLTLVRDPQGLSTIFYIQDSGGIIFSTELRLLYEILENKPDINLNYFVEHLANRNYALPEMPLQNVKELLPGMQFKFSFDGQSNLDLLWDFSNLKSSFIKEEGVFEEELLDTLKKCLKAWIGDAPGVSLMLSGGTDSSGIMLLLRDIFHDGKKIITINLIDSKNNSSNEIEYAKDVADACNVPLHFIDWQNTSLLDKMPQDWYPNKPSSVMLFYNYRVQLKELMRKENCPIFMTGQGGDHLFGAPPSIYALADYWLEHGFCGMKMPLKELSAVYRMPWGPILFKNAKAIINYYRKIFTLTDRKVEFFDKSFIESFKFCDFYIEDLLKNFYPAKARNFEFLHQAIAFSERDQFMHKTVVTHPLLSQPVVELALRIPTYQSFKDGYDRVFFRRAVSRIKHSKSLWRHIKGQTTCTMIKSCVAHANEIRDIVLNGYIANSGIIDKKALEMELAKMKHGQADGLWPIIHLLTAELWINHWGL